MKIPSKKIIFLILILIIIGIGYSRYSGGLCDSVVDYTMESALQSYAGSYEMPIEQILYDLHNRIVPSVCSEKGFHDAKEAKFTRWSERINKQQ